MLQGARVTLRGVRREDLERYWQFRNDLEVNTLAGFPSPGPVTLESVVTNYEEPAANPLEHWFAIEADSTFIGQCQLRNADMLAHHVELGITIGDRNYWSRGYGTEAVSLLLEFAFRNLNLRRVWLSTSSGNERALRCYEKCGFVEEGRLRQHNWLAGEYQDEVLMGVLREEWLARQR